jgi:hypothetical protein
MDERLKRIKEDMKKFEKEKIENEPSKEQITTIKSNYDVLTAQLFNIHADHSKLISEVRNKNIGVVKQLLEHMEK